MINLFSIIMYRPRASEDVQDSLSRRHQRNQVAPSSWSDQGDHFRAETQ